MSVKINQNETYLTLQWKDGFQSSYHYLWLRDNCNSNRDPQSGQRMILPLYLSKDIRPISVKINSDEQLEIQWNQDKHISLYDLGWLRQYDYFNTEDKKRWQPSLWDSSFDLTVNELDYTNLFDDENTIRNWLQDFKDYGFARLVNMPTDNKDILKKFGEKLSYLWGVTFGNLHDLKIIPNTTHIGNTNQVLVPHTDNAFSEPTTPVQAIHCIVNESEGGESTLVDGFKVASVLRKEYPKHFELLSSHMLTFRNVIEGNPISCEAPVIQVNLLGEVTQIRYANHVVLPFHLPMNLTEAYYEAYLNFTRMINSDEFQIQFKLAPGDFNMIDNYRLLHGRTAFNKGGNRHLRLMYIGRDMLYGQLNKLTQKQTVSKKQIKKY